MSPIFWSWKWMSISNLHLSSAKLSFQQICCFLAYVNFCWNIACWNSGGSIFFQQDQFYFETDSNSTQRFYVKTSHRFQSGQIKRTVPCTVLSKWKIWRFKLEMTAVLLFRGLWKWEGERLEVPLVVVLSLSSCCHWSVAPQDGANTTCCAPLFTH